MRMKLMTGMRWALGLRGALATVSGIAALIVTGQSLRAQANAGKVWHGGASPPVSAVIVCASRLSPN